MSPSPSRDPLTLQQQLSVLLAAADADARLASEMARARREFFGGDLPDYVGGTAAAEAAAQRFAEWFLLERDSDVLGEPPIRGMRGLENAGVEALRESVAGLFLVEAGGDDPQVRDLEDGRRLRLVAVRGELAPGDLLVGRLYPDDDDAWVPSAVTAVVGGAPQLAVAFQRDIRNLQLGRRLNQAEIEQLVIRGLETRGPGGDAPGPADEPIERLEAQLQSLLEAAGLDDEFRATTISVALRDSSGPGGVIGPLMDAAAFDSEIDLDRLRDLLVRIWNGHQVSPPQAATSAPPRAAVEAPPARPSSPTRRSGFAKRPDETLGEAMARRIEEGLGGGEDLEALFADCERLLGEPIDDDEDEPADLDDGDLAPLVREFAWETGADPDDERRLGALVAAQHRQPVPRVDVEAIDADDYARWLLEVWIGTAPEHRGPELRAAFGAAERFCAWLRETQEIDVGERLELAREGLIADLDRLAAVGAGLSGATCRGNASRVMLRVVETSREALRLATGGDDRGAGSATFEIPVAATIADRAEEGDVLFADLENGAGAPRLCGDVVVVPSGLERLLGV